jgi:hypothetical protein
VQDETVRPLISLAAASEPDGSFRSFEKIFELYAPEGEIKHLENLQPHNPNPIRHPLEFIHSFATSGEDPSTFIYPLPRVIAGLQ